MKRRITISLFAIFFLFVTGIIISMLYITDTVSELNHIIKLHQVEQLRRSLVISLQNVQSNLYTFDTPLAHGLDKIVENMEILEKTAVECSSCHHPPHLNSRIIHVQSLVRDYARNLSYYMTGSANEERMRKLKLSAATIGDKILSQTEDMSHSASEALEQLTKNTTDEINDVKKILIITILISLLIGIIIAFTLTQSITNPVRKLLEATRMIASGKLGTTVSYSDRTELGELAENFNTMSIGLGKRSSELEEKSSELKKRIDELEEFYDMAVGRELRMKQLKEEIDKLRTELSRHKKSQ
jgi:methyl-accepting chemotaxis protein